MKVAVIGAGHAGLIAAQMLRRELYDVTVSEIKNELPLNHASVLRFRTDALQKALGVPLKKVRVIKDVVDSRGIIPDSLNYAKKVTGEYRTDRSVPIKPEVVERYVYDGNLSKLLSRDLNIVYGVDAKAFPEWMQEQSPIISTIPMDSFTDGVTKEEFKRSHSTCITAHLVGVDAYLSAYVSNPDSFIARISVTGSLMQVDIEKGLSFASGDSAYSFIDEALELIGIFTLYRDVTVHAGSSTKLLPIDERERKRIIMKLTDDLNIYSVGRQATWRPKLLLDDVVDDVRKVIMMLRGYSNKLVDKKEYSNV